MCTRYTIVARAEEIAQRFQVDVPSYYRPHYNAAPSQLLPVITQDSPEGVSQFYWGLSPERSRNKTISERIINVRCEAILEKPVLKKAIMNRRCLVIADGFYEWKKLGKKTIIPHRVVRTDRNLFAFAGTWEEYEDESGSAFHTFSIVTTEANEIVKSIHDRMPVILKPELEQAWLNAATSEEEILGMLTPYPTEWTDLYSVSPRVNSVEMDVPSLILPAPPADQFGNLTLFG